ncbi:MAG: cytochrome C peroxidase [Saprospiraceae bacterium]|nr:cytochrome C peroxidase [Saprospiraceae bacterium]
MNLIVANDDDLTRIPYTPQYFELKIPINFPKMEIPSDNPITTEGVELGRRLFYDPILSRDSSISCGSCHAPNLAFTDGKAVSTGIDGKIGVRSAMSLENVGFITHGLFWDGRVKTLEEQALLPIEDPVEMHHTWGEVEEKLQKHRDYPNRFRRAFGISTKKEITKTLAVKALAQFERTLISGNSPYDRITSFTDFSDDAFDGYKMFMDAGGPDAHCSHCHAPPFFNARDFFNNGLDSVNSLDDFRDKGLGALTKKRVDNGKFRATSLRNIAFSAPYMHDGRFKTLEEVVEHYTSKSHYADNVDPFIPDIKIKKFTERQKKQLVIFLKTLSDTSFYKIPHFAIHFCNSCCVILF